MKVKQIYRLMSKDPKEEYCFIGATVNISQAIIRIERAIEEPTSKSYNNDIFEYIRSHGGKDGWIFEEIPRNENGDSVHFLNRYEVGEYENMKEESKKSINRRAIALRYRKNERYLCECGREINKVALKTHQMSLQHTEYKRILKFNEANRIYCGCGKWIDKYAYKTHLIYCKKLRSEPPHESN